MKEDPDKPKKMRSKNEEDEEESPALPATDVSFSFCKVELILGQHMLFTLPLYCMLSKTAT